MGLTERRKQFLEHIVHLYEETNLPVHYSTVAEAIGVSKWTAYDVLKELESHGYLERTYSVNPHETGRSVVVFLPTKNCEGLFQRSENGVTTAQEWERIKEKAFTLLEETESLRQGVDQCLQRMAKVELRVEFCVYFLGVLILYLNSLGPVVRRLSLNVITVSQNAVLQLTIFVGTVVGMIIQTVGDELSPEMAGFITQFLAAIEKLTPDELEMLIEFLSEYDREHRIEGK